MAVYLTTAELKAIEAKLTPLLALAELRTICLAANQRLEDIYVGSFNSARLGDVVVAVLSYFNKQGQNDDFFAQVKSHFRSTLAAADPDPEIVVFIFSKLAAASAGAFSPSNALVVPPRMLFFNRRGLRSALDKLTVPTLNFRILTISGPVASGKSHSYFLIEHAGRRQAGADVVRQLLNDYLIDETVEPYELMEAIAQKISLDTRTMPRAIRSQDARTVIKLVNWFVGMLAKRPADNPPIWLVIDGFNLVGCPDWAHQMGYRIANEIAQRGTLPMKLILIGIDPSRLDRDALSFTARDQAIHVSPDDVWDFISSFAASHQLSVDQVPRDILLAGFFDGLPTPPDHAAGLEIATRVEAWLNNLRPGLLP